jgi:hypothetical protein
MNPVVVMGGVWGCALLLAFYYKKKGPYCCWVRTQEGVLRVEGGGKGEAREEEQAGKKVATE